MPTKLTFIYLASLFMLFYGVGDLQKKVNFFKIPRIKNYSSIELKSYSKFKNKKLADLFIGYISGNKLKLTRKDKNRYKLINLYHLFTPSGIHLSALYLLISPVLLYLKKRSLLVFSLFSSFLCMPVFLFEKFYSLKRISLLRISYIINSFFGLNLSVFSLFIFTFVVDLFIGTYGDNSLSYIFSFLFLGIILSRDGFSNIYLPLKLLGGQLIISFFLSAKVTVIGFLFSYILTIIFSLFFPIWFITFWFPYSTLVKISQLLLKFFDGAVFFFHDIAIYSGVYYVDWYILIGVILMSLKLRYKIKMYLLLLLMFFYSPQVINLPTMKQFNNKYNSSSSKKIRVNNYKITKTKTDSRSYRIYFNDGWRCSFKLHNGFYDKKCWCRD